MKKYMFMSLTVALLCAITLSFAACNDDEKDMTRPTITDTGITANPINCQVYQRGDTIPFRYVFTDDMELGNFNIEIHNNFDGHSHSTEGHETVECEEEEEEEEHHGTGNPWVFNQNYAIPTGLQSYNASVDIPIPTDIAPGHYHFMVLLSDKAGWQELKSISIKIKE